jgi:hypothetical protein
MDKDTKEKFDIKTIFPKQEIPLEYKPDVGSLSTFRLSVRIDYDGIDGKGYWYQYDAEYEFSKETFRNKTTSTSIKTLKTDWDGKGKKIWQDNEIRLL